MYSVYGLGQALDNPCRGALGIFLGNLLRGEPITIFGVGEQTKSILDWEPRTTFEPGLAGTLRWGKTGFAANRPAPRSVAR